MIIGIDIGSSTIKMISYENNQILDKEITTNLNIDKVLKDFIQNNDIKIEKIKKIIATGIGANNLNYNKYNIPIEKVEEFKAIATGGLYLSKKEEAIIVSIGTGTALIKSNGKEVKHLGGTRYRSRNTNKSL